MNFDLKKSNRKCHEDEQSFKPGEIFYSALMELDDGQTERRDYCDSHWEEPAEDCVGWWKSRVPESGKGKVYWAPRKILLAYFEHTLETEASFDIAFVTSLMLVQKKILVLEEELDSGQVIRLRNRLDRKSYDVQAFDLEAERVAEIQAILAEQLFMDEPVDDTKLEEVDD